MQPDLLTCQLIRNTPDLTFGEDQNGYTCKVLAWAAERGYSNTQAVQVARMKWQALEVEGLIHRLEDGSDAALREAVILLMKDLYAV